MTNWYINFEVTGKYLSDAQEAIHGLRGVTNIGVKPIKERAPRLNGLNGSSGLMRDAILKAMTTKSLRSVEVFDVLAKAGIDTTVKKTNSNMGNMERAGLLRRVKPGVFAITKKGRDRVKSSQG